MTTLFRSRQRAEDFAARVDGTSLLRSAADPVTERLVAVPTLLRTHGATDPAAVPRDDFATDLRERLMLEAVTVLTAANTGLTLPPRTRGKRERRLAVVASAAVLIGGTAGIAAAAQGSLPGEALYPLKRGIEKVQADLSTSSAGRGRDLLQQASDRLTEAQGLVDQGSPTATPQVPHAVDEFTAQAREGAALMLASYRDTGNPDTIVELRSFAATGLRSVEALSTTAPADAQPGLRDAALALQGIDLRASRLCDTCGGAAPLRLPPAFLASAEVDRAMQRVQSAKLDNSHPFVGPRQAVADSRPPTTTGDAKQPSGKAAGATAPQAPATDVPLPSAPSSGGLPRVKVKADIGGSDLGEGLGDAVATILPDPSDLLP
jgi:hypothetical protein